MRYLLSPPRVRLKAVHGGDYCRPPVSDSETGRHKVFKPKGSSMGVKRLFFRLKFSSLFTPTVGSTHTYRRFNSHIP